MKTGTPMTAREQHAYNCGYEQAKKELAKLREENQRLKDDAARCASDLILKYGSDLLRHRNRQAKIEVLREVLAEIEAEEKKNTPIKVKATYLIKRRVKQLEGE